MLGYIFVAIALFSGAVKGYCGKRTSGFVSNYKDAVFVNMFRMIFCVIIGFFMILTQGNLYMLKVDVSTVLICALSGVTTSLFVVLWLLSVKRGAYMMLDVFLMLGVVVTIVLSYFSFGEKIRISQIAGLLILFVSVGIMCSYSSSIKGRMNFLSMILLILCGVCNGLTDFSQKLYVSRVQNSSVAVFNFYTYIFSTVVLFLLFLFFKKKDKSGENKSGSILKSIIFYVIIMSVCLFANSFFKTLAAGYIPSARLYPLNQGCSLILSSLMSAVLFKEKLTKKCILGLLLAFAGLLVINLL